MRPRTTPVATPYLYRVKHVTPSYITLSQPRRQRRGPLPTFAGAVASHPGIQTLHFRDVAVKVIAPPLLVQRVRLVPERERERAENLLILEE